MLSTSQEHSFGRCSNFSWKWCISSM